MTNNYNEETNNNSNYPNTINIVDETLYDSDEKESKNAIPKNKTKFFSIITAILMLDIGAFIVWLTVPFFEMLGNHTAGEIVCEFLKEKHLPLFEKSLFGYLFTFPVLAFIGILLIFTACVYKKTIFIKIASWGSLGSILLLMLSLTQDWYGYVNLENLFEMMTSESLLSGFGLIFANFCVCSFLSLFLEN